MNKTSSFKKIAQHFLPIIASFLLVYLIVLNNALGVKIWEFYNSDSIYLPYLYRDLFINGGQISQWTLPFTPYFFPSAVIYFFLVFVSQDLRFAIILFAVIQLLAYYWLIVAAGKIATKDENQPPTLFHLSALLSLLLFAGDYLQQELFNGLVTTRHFGATLMYLVGIILLIKTFSARNFINYLLLFLICLLTTFSDILFLVQFSLPAIVTLLILALLNMDYASPPIRKIFNEQRRRYLLGIFIIGSGSMLGYLLLKNSSIFNIHLAESEHVMRDTLAAFIAGVLVIYHNLNSFYEKNAIAILLLFSYAFASLGFSIKLVINYYRKKKLNVTAPYAFLVIMLLISMMVGFFSIIVYSNSLHIPGYQGFRHYQPFILFPIFLGIPLFLTRYSNLNTLLSKHYAYLVAILVIAAYLFTPKGSIKNIYYFYPEHVACFDNFAKKYHLQNGIGNYWDAKAYNFLTKQHINIINATIDDTASFLIPRFVITTKHDYMNNDYNFIIMETSLDGKPYAQSPSEEFVRKAYGKPLHEFNCPSLYGKKKIFVYKIGTIKLSNSATKRIF